MPRCEMTESEAWSIINRALREHHDCDRTCDAFAAAEARLFFYAADYLDGAGCDDNGDLARALHRVDPGRARRDSECSTFAKLPYVVCGSCNTTYHGDEPAWCCGAEWQPPPPPPPPPPPSPPRCQAVTAPHGRCPRAGHCVEHQRNRKVPPCR